MAVHKSIDGVAQQVASKCNYLFPKCQMFTGKFLRVQFHSIMKEVVIKHPLTVYS